jgi:hypothetical protein
MTSDTFDPYLHWLGIPPHERPVDHYRLLGVALFEPDSRRIEEAADARMNLVRSYQSGPRVAYTQKLLNELSAARLCLTNPQSKASYDAVLRGRQVLGVANQPSPPPSPPSLPPGFGPAALPASMPPLGAAPPMGMSPMGMSPSAAPMAIPVMPQTYAVPMAIPLASPLAYPSAMPYGAPPPLMGASVASPVAPSPPTPPPAYAPSPAPPPVSAVGGPRSSANETMPEPLAPPLGQEHAEASSEGKAGKRKRIALIVAGGLVLLIGGGLGIASRMGRGGSRPAEDAAEEQTPTVIVVGKREDHGNPNHTRSTIDDPFGSVEVVQEGTGEMHFPAQIAELAGEGVLLELRGDDQVVAGWGGPSAQSISWNFRLVKPDIFRVELTYAATDEARGGRWVLMVDDGEPKAAEVVSTGGMETFRTDILHVTAPRSGKHRLTLSVEGMERPGGLVFKTLRFIPKGIGDKKKS